MKDILRRNRFPLIVLLLLHLLFLWPVLLGREVFYLRDLFHYFYPYKSWLMSIYREPSWPLWDESIYLGKSLIGDLPVGIFDPMNLLYLVMPVESAFQYFFVINLLLFAWGMFAFLRSLGASEWGSFLAAFTISFSPAFLFQTTHTCYFGGYSLIPWFLYFLHRVVQAPNRVAVAGFALVVANQLLRGEPQTVYLEMLLTSLTGIVLFGRSKRKSQFLSEPFVGALLAGGVLTVLLTLCVLLPTLTFLAQTVRAKGLDASIVLSGSFPPARLLEYLQPYPFGNPLHGEAWNSPVPLDQGLSSPWAYSYHLGWMFPFLTFFLFPIRSLRNRRVFVSSMSSAALFLLLGFGSHLPVLSRLFFVIPGWTLFRTPEKFILFANLALVVALGLAWGEGGELRPTIKRWVRRPELFLFVLIGLHVFQLGWLRTTAPLTRSNAFFTEPPAIAAIRGDISKDLVAPRLLRLGNELAAPVHYLHRTSFEWETLLENTGLLYGLSYANGYSSSIPSNANAIRSAFQSDPVAHLNLYNIRYVLGAVNSKISTLSVRYEDPSGRYALYENMARLPRYFLVESAERPRIQNGEFQIGTNVRREIPVQIQKRNNHVTDLEMDLPANSTLRFWLLWSANVTPEWKAQVNGQQAQIETIYPGLQAVSLGHGKQAVHLGFEPFGIKLAVTVSGVSLLACLLLPRRRTRIPEKKPRRNSSSRRGNS